MKLGRKDKLKLVEYYKKQEQEMLAAKAFQKIAKHLENTVFRKRKKELVGKFFKRQAESYGKKNKRYDWDYYKILKTEKGNSVTALILDCYRTGMKIYVSSISTREGRLHRDYVKISSAKYYDSISRIFKKNINQLIKTPRK